LSRLERDIEFKSRGVRCGGILILPDGGGPHPLVIMAHGFGAQMDFGLRPFADRFTGRGMAVMMFDYRNFGRSDGRPRNLVDPFRHVEDWKAAVSHARGITAVDACRIALWGTSFSGGHVITVAAGDPDIACIVAQVPFVDGPSSAAKAGGGAILKGTFAAVRDIAQSAILRRPYCVPIVSAPDKYGLMNTPESKPGYMALVPPVIDWRNAAPARVGLQIPRYSPIRYAGRVRCPALIVAAEKDSLISLKKVKKAADMIEHSEFFLFPGGHFEPYIGEGFETVAGIEEEFLSKHLLE